MESAAERVRRLTDSLRHGTEPRWITLREYLAAEAIDPGQAALTDLFSDGEDRDTGVLVVSDGHVYQFSLEYQPAQEQVESVRSVGLPTDMETLLNAISLRSEMQADVASWYELYDVEAQSPQSPKIEAGKAQLREEA